MPDNQLIAEIAGAVGTPIIALALLGFALRGLLPAPISAEGWLCYRLLVQPNAAARWRFRTQAAGRLPWLAAMVVLGAASAALQWRGILPAHPCLAGLATLGGAVLMGPITVLLLTGTTAPPYARRNGR